MVVDSDQHKQNPRSRIAICVVTYFRPDGLQRLLDGIDRLRFTKNDAPEIRIIVVDNDAEGSSKQVCDEFTANSLIPLTYDVEPQRGIPFARNRSVDHAIDYSDFVAIIDDDEVPASSWIDELMHVQRCYDADVVTGPVLSYFIETPPAWTIKGRFYEKTGIPTGQVINENYNYVYSGNLFARTDVFRNVRFSGLFALCGGEDTHLFMQINQAGLKVVWANDALVTEWVPASRTSAQWLFQRAYRRGNSFTLCEIEINPSIHVRIVRALKGVVHITCGLGLACLSLGCKIRLIRSFQSIFLGAGMIAGVLGKRYDEYETIHRV